MSNAERQRRFRAAHPGYFNKYNHRRTALRLKAYAAAQAAAMAAKKQQAQTQETPAAPPATATPLAIPVSMQLCLPAPVVDPTIAAIEALRAKLKTPLAA